MGVYFVCVLLFPTRKQRDEEGTGAQIIVNPVAVLADSEAMAAAKAWRFIPEEHQAKEDRLGIQVLPFRSTGTQRASG